MTTRTRDSLALYIIAAAAVMVTLYADADIGTLFAAMIERL
jgi:hypothetical protein